LAITALLEARLHQLIADPELDPLVMSQLPSATRSDDLAAISNANEVAAAQKSLDATLTHWQDGRKIAAREWVEALYDEVFPIAKQKGFSCFLLPLKKILREGNEAQRWLRLKSQGWDDRAILMQAIQAMKAQEMELQSLICQPVVA
jgi:predicted glutamate--cysteine ligase